MRLIDADALNRGIFEIGCHKTKIHPMDVMDIIKEQPTAYNVEQVIEDIERASICTVNAQGKPIGSWLDTNKAKALVMAGGQGE